MSEYTSNELNEPQDGAAFLGMEVKSAREFVGMTQQQLADATHYKRPYVTKVEGGTLLASENFAEACDRIFERPGSFARLRRRVSQSGHPGWFIPYVTLEERATEILDFSNYLVMGMLQTHGYAEALFRAANPRDPDVVINEKVCARLQRHEIMERDEPPLLWAVLDESCLHRLVGAGHTMRGQLEHLLEEAQSPHITMQVLPFRTGAPAAAEAYTLLRFDDSDSEPVLYSEAQGLGRVIDSAKFVKTATARYDRLRADALSPEDSLEMLRTVLEEFRS
ncbi:helix-turn-helix transcriptional regulator [Streptomyces sp. NPDC005953]|uniref:helix-turn-helix domain-containing protein n=1 Tax=unclassified Streptomyces TaxID=2593676 RepID=UPI0034112312